MCRPIIQIYECGCSHLIGKRYCEWRKQYGAEVPYGLVDEDYALEAWCLIEEADEPVEIRENEQCVRCKEIAEQWVMV